MPIASWRRSCVADVYGLFDEYAREYASGERPQASRYLARAGEGADELAGLIDRFLSAVPQLEPDEEARRSVAALLAAERRLAALRERRRLRVEEVVDALMAQLALDPAKRAKVERYYRRLENGVLEPARVSRRVFAVLGELLGPEATWAAPQPAGQMTFSLRAARAEPAAAAPVAAMKPAEPQPETEDEIDRLFGENARIHRFGGTK
jgi:hypothetical protein